MGTLKTFHRLQDNFYWPGMRKDVRDFVAQCPVCQIIKYETRRPSGLLQPLPIPTVIWEDLFLDFITGLPPSNGFTAILVIVDRFSKGAHFGALPTTFTAYKVAILFLDLVCKHHGMPRTLVSDRDPIFISRFWQDLFTLCGTKLRMSTTYHPETDGQTEVLNRVLEHYLRSFTHSKPSQWSSYLSLAEWSYNTSVHSSTGISPFQITYGKPPPSIPQYLANGSNIEAVDTILLSRQEILAKIHSKLLKTQAQMKHYADLKRRPCTFKVGNFVYVKLRPYRQLSLTGHSHNKLSPRFYGPFTIIDQCGPVAFKLDLPDSSKIHPVFHSSLLKPYHGTFTAITEPLPADAFNNHPLIIPLAILDSKMDMSTTPPRRQVLVQWLGLAPEDTSWEDWETLTLQYHLEDKVVFPPDGNVSMGRPKRTKHQPNYLRDYQPK